MMIKVCWSKLELAFVLSESIQYFSSSSVRNQRGLSFPLACIGLRAEKSGVNKRTILCMIRSLSGFFLEFFCQKNPSSCVKLKYHSTVAYSIFEQLTNPIEGLQQCSSALGSSPIVGKKFLRKWVKSGHKKSTARICSYIKFYVKICSQIGFVVLRLLIMFQNTVMSCLYQEFRDNLNLAI